MMLLIEDVDDWTLPFSSRAFSSSFTNFSNSLLFFCCNCAKVVMLGITLLLLLYGVYPGKNVMFPCDALLLLGMLLGRLLWLLCWYGRLQLAPMEGRELEEVERSEKVVESAGLFMFDNSGWEWESWLRY